MYESVQIGETYESPKPITETKEDSTKLSRRLYISGFPASVTNLEIAKAFENFGEVTNVEIDSSNQDSAEQAGFVTFDTRESAMRALENARFVSIREKQIMVCEATPKKTQIFVGGLGPNVEDETLHEHFAQYGQIADAIVKRDPRTGASRCFGFVTFLDCDHVCKQLCDRRFIDCLGKKIEVKKATPISQYFRHLKGPENQGRNQNNNNRNNGNRTNGNANMHQHRNQQQRMPMNNQSMHNMPMQAPMQASMQMQPQMQWPMYQQQMMQYPNCMPNYQTPGFMPQQQMQGSPMMQTASPMARHPQAIYQAYQNQQMQQQQIQQQQMQQQQMQMQQQAQITQQANQQMQQKMQMQQQQAQIVQQTNQQMMQNQKQFQAPGYTEGNPFPNMYPQQNMQSNSTGSQESPRYGSQDLNMNQANCNNLQHSSLYAMPTMPEIECEESALLDNVMSTHQTMEAFNSQMSNLSVQHNPTEKVKFGYPMTTQIVASSDSQEEQSLVQNTKDIGVISPFLF